MGHQEELKVYVAFFNLSLPTWLIIPSEKSEGQHGPVGHQEEPNVLAFFVLSLAFFILSLPTWLIIPSEKPEGQHGSDAVRQEPEDQLAQTRQPATILLAYNNSGGRQ